MSKFRYVLCGMMLINAYAQNARAQDAGTESEATAADQSEQAKLSLDDIESQIPKGFFVGGAAMAWSERYIGQDEGTQFFPGFVYIGDKFRYLGDRASYTFYKKNHVSFDLVGRYRFGNLSPDDSIYLAGMNERKGQVELGLGVNALTKVGLFSGKVSTDASNRSKGSQAAATWHIPYYRNNLLIMPSVGISWYDSKTSNYYFGGVSVAESTLTRPAYDTGSNTSVNLMLTVAYRINPKWIVAGGVLQNRYSSGISNSPIIADDNEVNYFLAAAYHWQK